MKRINQKGFAVLETFLLIVIIVLLAGIGYYVWHSNKQAASTYKAASNSAQSSPAPKAPKTSAKADDAAVSITEWGVKVTFADADKVTYKMDANSAALLLKPSVTTNEECQDLGVGFVRDPAQGSPAAANAVSVGEHSYGLEGAPAACDDGADNSALNQLRSKITGDELGGNHYTITAIE